MISIQPKHLEIVKEAYYEMEKGLLLCENLSCIQNKLEIRKMVDVQFLRDEILKRIRETGQGSLIKIRINSHAVVIK